MVNSLLESDQSILLNLSTIHTTISAFGHINSEITVDVNIRSGVLP